MVRSLVALLALSTASASMIRPALLSADKKVIRSLCTQTRDSQCRTQTPFFFSRRPCNFNLGFDRQVSTPAPLEKSLALRGGGMVDGETYVKICTAVYALYGAQFLGVPGMIIDQHFDYVMP